MTLILLEGRLPFPCLAVAVDSNSLELIHLEVEEKEPISEPGALHPVPDMEVSSDFKS